MLAINLELTAEQRILKAMTAIMSCPKYVALGGALLIGNHVVKNDIPTACTDGKNCYYGRAFVDSLTDAELRFLILHETFCPKHEKTKANNLIRSSLNQFDLFGINLIYFEPI